MNLKEKQISQLADFINHINQQAIVKKCAAKYPRLTQFVLERLSLSQFKGLPLTLLMAVFTANLFLFNEIAESIVNSPLMLGIDYSFAQFLFKIRNNTIANTFYYFSMLGSFYVVIIIALITSLILVWEKQFTYLISLMVALIGIAITVFLGKQYFHRIRPEDYSFYTENSYSFPSGHAIASIAFYGLLFYMIIRFKEKHKLRWTIFAILFISLLGFSRLYLCVHFISDVLAGYSLGFLWFLLSISLIEWKAMRSKKQVF